MLMCRLTDLVRQLQVVTGQFVRRHSNGVQRLVVGEIEHPRQLSPHHPQFTWQKVVYHKALAASLVSEFRDHARPCCAEIDDWVAVRPVEPSAESSSTIATARVESTGLVAVSAHREPAVRQFGSLAVCQRRTTACQPVTPSAMASSRSITR